MYMSKVKDLADTVEAVKRLEGRQEALVGDESDVQFVRNRVRLKGFARLDEAVLKPFFVRKFTEEVGGVVLFVLSIVNEREETN